MGASQDEAELTAQIKDTADVILELVALVTENFADGQLTPKRKHLKNLTEATQTAVLSYIQLSRKLHTDPNPETTEERNVVLRKVGFTSKIHFSTSLGRKWSQRNNQHRP